MKKIIISGEIGWGVSAESIREKLKVAGGDSIEAHFSSPGGSVFAGLEIHSLFLDYRRTYPAATMTSRIIGLAASMASYLALNPAFNRIAAEDFAVLMIHNTTGGVSGDYREMAKMAEILDKLNDTLAAAYAARTRKSLQAIRKMMDEETWFFGDEIKDAGFVDEIISTDAAPVDRNTAIARAKSQFSAIAPKVVADVAAYSERMNLTEFVQRENPILGKDLSGKTVFSSDVKSRPSWWKCMSTLTPYGEKVAAEIREAIVGLDDGVIRNEDDLMAQVRADRITLGFDELVINNVGISEAERAFRKQVDDDRRRLGLEPRYNV